MNASETAAKRYGERTAEIRRTMDRSTRAFAQAMSDACREYEAAMRKAASGGDESAKAACAASEGPYLNP